MNYAMLRRVKGAVAARAAWTAADFDASFPEVAPAIPPAVRAVLEPWYGAGVVPRPEDTLRRFLKMKPDDIEDVVAAAAERLGQAAPPGDAYALADVASLVRLLATWRG